MRFGTLWSPIPSSRIEWSISWKKGVDDLLGQFLAARIGFRRPPEEQDHHDRKHLETAHDGVRDIQIAIEERHARHRRQGRVLAVDDRVVLVFLLEKAEDHLNSRYLPPGTPQPAAGHVAWKRKLVYRSMHELQCRSAG